METIKKPILLCISGVKNAGKTTCIENLLPRLVAKGLRVATIKHDGHDFIADVPTTDTYRHKQAGAYGTAIFSKHKYMVIKEQQDTKEEEIIQCFLEADLIIMEGFKHSHYPKIEIVRGDNKQVPVCDEQTLIAYVSDVTIATKKQVIGLSDYDTLTKIVYTFYKQERNKRKWGK